MEGDLLAKVSQRYQPNVAMTNLDHIKPERLKSAIAVILAIFEKACRYMPGHSQPQRLDEKSFSAGWPPQPGHR